MIVLIVVGDKFQVEVITVKKSVFEDYLNEGTIEDAVSEWCADEYGWPECDGLWELLDTGEWNKIF